MNSVVLDGLSPLTQYLVYVYSVVGEVSSEPLTGTETTRKCSSSLLPRLPLHNTYRTGEGLGFLQHTSGPLRDFSRHTALWVTLCEITVIPASLLVPLTSTCIQCESFDSVMCDVTVSCVIKLELIVAHLAGAGSHDITAASVSKLTLS